MAMHMGYSSGHCWYYHLGGPPLFPKQIQKEVQHSGYLGYRDNITPTADLPEPVRSERLRLLRGVIVNDLQKDLNRYRQVVLKLHMERRIVPKHAMDRVCSDVCLAVSLKHNHLFNDFAHLLRINYLLGAQPDLFAS